MHEVHETHCVLFIVYPIFAGQGGGLRYRKGFFEKKVEKSLIFRHSFACKICDYFKITLFAFELNNASNEVSKNV